MKGEIELFWVVLCKHGEPLYSVAGPFGLWEKAENARDDLDPPSGACHLEVMKSKLHVFEA